MTFFKKTYNFAQKKKKQVETPAKTFWNTPFSTQKSSKIFGENYHWFFPLNLVIFYRSSKISNFTTATLITTFIDQQKILNFSEANQGRKLSLVYFSFKEAAVALCI